MAAFLQETDGSRYICTMCSDEKKKNSDWLTGLGEKDENGNFVFEFWFSAEARSLHTDFLTLFLQLCLPPLKALVPVF